jgi:hypothetical protein
MSMADMVRHRSMTTDSALAELMDITRTSVWRVLLVARVEAL